jgi:hypothetical protein
MQDSRSIFGSVSTQVQNKILATVATSYKSSSDQKK